MNAVLELELQSHLRFLQWHGLSITRAPIIDDCGVGLVLILRLVRASGRLSSKSVLKRPMMSESTKRNDFKLITAGLVLGQSLSVME
jgi:hypothetical protein